MRNLNLAIQSIIYGNPNYYPPMINGAYVFDQHNMSQVILRSSFLSSKLPNAPIEYPSSTKVTECKAPFKGTPFEYPFYIIKAVQKADAETVCFIGYDMHGLLPAWLASRLYGKPLIYHNHDFVEDDRKVSFAATIVKRIEQLIARSADDVIVPDKGRAEAIQKQLKLKKSPIVVANAPRIDRQIYSGDKLHATLKNLGKQFEKIVFRQGGIGLGHSIEKTIKSMPLWNSEQWAFIIMGPIQDQDFVDEVTDLAHKLNLAGRFIILPPVSYPEVAKFTPGADIGHALYDPIHINNQYITTASNKIMEYMASGLPLILSDTRSSRDLLNRYACGLVADVDSPESIAEAINTILGDEASAQRMSEESLRAHREEFNYEHQYQPVIDLIKSYSKADNS